MRVWDRSEMDLGLLAPCRAMVIINRSDIPARAPSLFRSPVPPEEIPQSKPQGCKTSENEPVDFRGFLVLAQYGRREPPRAVKHRSVRFNCNRRPFFAPRALAGPNALGPEHDPRRRTVCLESNSRASVLLTIWRPALHPGDPRPAKLTRAMYVKPITWAWMRIFLPTARGLGFHQK